MAIIHPWNEPVWRRLGARMVQLPHALLFVGPQGMGKTQVAQHLAQALLCEQTDASGAPCGACKGCYLSVAGNHPDFTLVAPPEPGKNIAVDQIRTLGELAALKPHTAKRRAIILAPADAMNVFAANSLLKLLEEPPPENYLILVSARPGRLPATIRSRCTRVVFPVPAATDALAWLAPQLPDATAAAELLTVAEGAPVAALSLAEEWSARTTTLLADTMAVAGGKADALNTAGQWKKLGARLALSWFQRYLSGLIRARMGVPVATGVAGTARQLQEQANRLDLKQLFAFFDVVSRNRAFAGDVLDETLLLEEVLISWAELNRI